MFIKEKTFLIIVVLLLLLFLIYCTDHCKEYYGSLLGTLLLFSNSYFGLGLGGLYGLLGLGGFYGLGMQGFYGLGGIYGFSGLYGLGSLYSGLGIMGLGGYYGAFSSPALDVFGMSYLLKDLGLLKTNSPTQPSATIQALLPLAPLPLSITTSAPLPPVANIFGTTLLPIYVAEQTGTWVGQWIAVDTTTTGILAGNMTLNIVEDPIIIGQVTGFAVLELNSFLGGGVNLTGTASNNIVTLGGSAQTTFGPKPLTVDIICTLNTPTHMTGTYQIADFLGGSVKIYEVGTFELELLPALI